MKTTQMEEKLWTAKQVAAFLKVSTRQVHRLTVDALMPACIRLGGNIRWRKEEIIAWLDAGAPNRERWNEMKAKQQG
jgi:predicted DNA-binding transcriptional regulator AlpA